MKFTTTARLCALTLSLGVAAASHAGTFSATLGQFDGSGNNITETWGTLSFAIPLGETAVSATLFGAFGNNNASSTSVHDVFADGILVASCPTTTSTCWNSGPNAWSHTFTGAELSIFNDGMVVMTTTQNDCCVVREGALSLRGITAAVPEPETYAMLLAGLGVMGAVARRRKAKQA